MVLLFPTLEHLSITTCDQAEDWDEDANKLLPAVHQLPKLRRLALQGQFKDIFYCVLPAVQRSPLVDVSLCLRPTDVQIITSLPSDLFDSSNRPFVDYL